MLTHEGIQKVSFSIEDVQSIDNLLQKFSQERLQVIRNVADHPFGTLHEAVWSSQPPRYMSVLELTHGEIILDTLYKGQAIKDDVWVSPCFIAGEGTFNLRCAFQFKVWNDAGLKLFLGLSSTRRQLFFWVYYSGQIYHVPFGNIFEGSEAICLGHNDKMHREIFHTLGQTNSMSLTRALALLSDSTWNSDTFHSRNIPILAALVRFDSNHSELPMLPPLQPDIIKKSAVATSKELVEVTARIIQTVM